jgi:Zn-dependent protease with chaperone function
VLFTDDLLAALTPPEAAAIFAHEVAHLEHYARRKLVLRDVLLLVVIGVGLTLLFWLGPQSEGAGILRWAWPLGCFLALLLAASRNQVHEHQSDLRAVELVQDPEALISALTKLHSLMRLPRRWGARAEGPQVSEIAIRSVVDPSEAVVMASDRLYWLRGMNPHSELDPSSALREARDCRSIRYDELADLRLEVGRGARRYLVATDSHGSKLQLALPPDAVATLKANLEGIELVVRNTSLEAAVLGFRTVHAFFFDAQVASLLIGLKAVVGIALCVLAVERSRKRLHEPRWAWQTTVVALGALASLHLLRGAGWVGSPLPTMELHLWARYDSGIVLALLGITAALWTLGGVRARVPALVTLAASALAFLTGTTWFRDQFGDDLLAKAAEPIALERLSLEPWRQHVVEGRVGDLQLSPTGSRVALRITHEEFPGQYVTEPSTFDVEVGESDFTSFVGWDLKFTNDNLVAVLTTSANGFALERFRVWPEHTQVDRIELPRLKSPTLRIDASGRVWEVASTDFGLGESILLRGRFGTEGYHESRWTFDEPDDLYPDELRTNSGAAALLLASRFDLGMVEYLPPFLAPLGSYSTLSEVSALHNSKRTSLAVTTLDLWCVEPMTGQRRFVCGGNDRESRTWLWSIDADRRTVTPMGALAGYYHGAKFARPDELLLQGYATAPVVIELGSRRARTLHVTESRDLRVNPVHADMEQAGFDGQIAAPVIESMGQHVSYQAMAKEGDVVALATFEGSASTVTVYRVGSAAIGALERQERE